MNNKTEIEAECPFHAKWINDGCNDMIWSLRTRPHDCGLIWIPNKRWPWKSPWRWQGGPASLHILGNRDVLSANTTDTSVFRIHQIQIELHLIHLAIHPLGSGWRSGSCYRCAALFLTLGSPLTPALRSFLCLASLCPWLLSQLRLEYGNSLPSPSLIIELTVCLCHKLWGLKKKFNFSKGSYHGSVLPAECKS